MVEKLKDLKGKKCCLTLNNNDSFIGVIRKIEFNDITTALRVVFEIEPKKDMTIQISKIKSITEITSPSSE